MAASAAVTGSSMLQSSSSDYTPMLFVSQREPQANTSQAELLTSISCSQHVVLVSIAASVSRAVKEPCGFYQLHRP